MHTGDSRSGSDAHVTRSAIVTGAARGIGAAIAEELLSEGLEVWCWDSAREALRETVDSFDKRFAGQVHAACCDISSPDSVRAAVSTFALSHDRLDVLVNNAGAWRARGKLAEVDENAWAADLNLLLGGPQRVTQAVDRLLGPGSRVVTISSVHGLAASPHWGTYDISKAALIQWSRVLAAELGPRGITTNVIAPGVIETQPYTDDLLRSFHRDAGLVPRVGEPADIARAVTFLSDPRNGFITGSVLTVDGGMTTRLALTALEDNDTRPSISKGDKR